MVEAFLEVLELAFFEVGEAFGGLKDENVWRRPAEGLLSVGELAGHIAYWEAVRMAFGGSSSDGRPDLDLCKVRSPLVDERFRYYPFTTPPSSAHLSMGATQVLEELLRVHKESMACFRTVKPDLDAKAPEWGSTWREYLKYASFHVAYHTGQMYSVRHLLGEETPDN